MCLEKKYNVIIRKSALELCLSILLSVQMEFLENLSLNCTNCWMQPTAIWNCQSNGILCSKYNRQQPCFGWELTVVTCPGSVQRGCGLSMNPYMLMDKVTKVKDKDFKYLCASEAPVLTARIPRVVVCHWLYKPHVSISQPHALVFSSSHPLHTISFSFHLPRRDRIQGWTCVLQWFEPNTILPVHTSEHVSDQLTTWPTEQARQTFYCENVQVESFVSHRTYMTRCKLQEDKVGCMGVT